MALKQEIPEPSRNGREQSQPHARLQKAAVLLAGNSFLHYHSHATEFPCVLAGQKVYTSGSSSCLVQAGHRKHSGDHLSVLPGYACKKMKKKNPPTKNKNKSNTHNQRKLQNTSQNWEISVYVTSSCLKPKVQQCCQWMLGLPLAQEKTHWTEVYAWPISQRKASFIPKASCAPQGSKGSCAADTQNPGVTTHYCHQ